MSGHVCTRGKRLRWQLLDSWNYYPYIILCVPQRSIFRFFFPALRNLRSISSDLCSPRSLTSICWIAKKLRRLSWGSSELEGGGICFHIENSTRPTTQLKTLKHSKKIEKRSIVELAHMWNYPLKGWPLSVDPVKTLWRTSKLLSFQH